jgi:NAD/NADP transhydrogenase alpha subunit
VFSDADFAGDKLIRRSTMGVIAIFADSAVSWTSQLQKMTALSTNETEIIAASEGAKGLVWLKLLLSELC